MRRVLMLSWEYPPIVEGGLARHARKLAEELVRRGDDVLVVTRGGGRLAAEEERHGVRVRRVREPAYPRDDLDAFIRWVARMNDDLEAAASASRADVVHSHDWLVAAAAERLARRLDVPWVVSVHATEHGRHDGWVRRWPQSHIHGAERRMVRRADAVIVCSRFMRRHVADAFNGDPARVTVIPNGIDPADFPPVADLPALRARFAGPGERLVLLVGRLVHEKGFHVALDAVAEVAPRTRFVLAGTGMAEGELKEQAERLGLLARGAFLGWIGDELLAALYRVADVCVVPSIYEPFGLVALEAMACGCPCLVADTGGLREVVPSGGLRFPAGDAQALAALLERVLADEPLRARLSAEAAEHVRRFDWAGVAAQTAGVYAEVGRATV